MNSSGMTHSGPYSLPQVQQDLRVLRVRAGEPTFTQLGEIITQRRRARGLPEDEAYVSRSTVYDCFGKRRKRMDPDLVLDIVQALNVSGAELQTWQRRLEVALGHSSASTVVTVSDRLPSGADVFVGREAYLGWINQHMDGGGGVIWLSGMPGVGKSSLAAEAARRFTAEQPGATTLTVDLRGFSAQGPPAEPRAVLEALLRQLDEPAAVRTSMSARAETLRSRLSQTPHVLILDDAASAEQIAPIIPETAGLWVIVTSRSSAPTMPAALHLTLEPLSHDESLQLLGGFAGAERLETEYDAAAGLAQAAGYLPLALRLTGARLSRYADWSLGDHLELMTSRRDALRLEDPVSQAFGSTYEALPAESQMMLRLLAVHPVAMLDTPSAQALADSVVVDPAAALQILVENSLLTQPGPRHYVLHELLRVHAADLSMEQDSPALRRRAQQRLQRYALSGLWSAYTAMMVADHGLPRSPRGHVEVQEMTVEQAERFLEDSTDLLLLIAYSGQPAEAVAGDAAPPTLVMVSEAINGWLYRSGRLRDAIELHRAALEMSEAEGDQTGRVRAQLDIARALILLGDTKGTVQILEEAEAATVEDITEKIALNNTLGSAYDRLGKPQEAEYRLRRCIELAEAHDDLKHQSYAWSNLGGVYRRTERLDLAKETLERSREICEATDDVAGVARCSTNLAYLLIQQENYVEAEQAAMEGLKNFQELQLVPGIVISRVNLANSYVAREMWSDGMDHYEQALREAKDIAMAEYQINALNGLSQAHQQMGNPAEGERCAAEALSLAVEVEDPFEQANSHMLLGDCLADQQNSAEAEQHWRKAEALYAQVGSDGVDDARARLAS